MKKVVAALLFLMVFGTSFAQHVQCERQSQNDCTEHRALNAKNNKESSLMQGFNEATISGASGASTALWNGFIKGEVKPAGDGNFYFQLAGGDDESFDPKFMAAYIITADPSAGNKHKVVRTTFEDVTGKVDVPAFDPKPKGITGFKRVIKVHAPGVDTIAVSLQVPDTMGLKYLLVCRSGSLLPSSANKKGQGIWGEDIKALVATGPGAKYKRIRYAFVIT